jgi:hypothetical protein
MNNKFIYRQAYKLPKGRRILFAFYAQASRIDCYWEPAIPTGKLMQKLMQAYRAARHHFLSSIDLPMAVVEL